MLYRIINKGGKMAKVEKVENVILGLAVVYTMYVVVQAIRLFFELK